MNHDLWYTNIRLFAELYYSGRHLKDVLEIVEDLMLYEMSESEAPEPETTTEQNHGEEEKKEKPKMYDFLFRFYYLFT